MWQGGVNLFTDYPDDAAGERIFKSGRAGFVGWLGFGGSVIQWRPDLHIGFAYACTLLTWWDMANTKEGNTSVSPIFSWIKYDLSVNIKDPDSVGSADPNPDWESGFRI